MKNQENIDQDLMKRSEYEASYRELGNDDYFMSIAEEGLEDYSDQLKDTKINPEFFGLKITTTNR